MEIGAFYDTAKDFAEKIKTEKPNYVSDDDSALCLILTDKQEIFSGVTSVGIRNDNVTTVSAESAAIMSMKAAGQTNALLMITVLFSDYSISKPDKDRLEMLLAASTDNYGCEIVVSAEETATVMSLQSDSTSEFSDFFNGFDDDPESTSEVDEDVSDGSESESVSSLGAPAEFASGVDIDESNPFYEPPTADEPPKNVLASMENVVKDKYAVSTGSEKAADSDNETSDEEKSATTDSDTSANALDSAPSKAEKKKSKNSMSKGDLLKQAKKRKKVARANFNFRKRV